MSVTAEPSMATPGGMPAGMPARDHGVARRLARRRRGADRVVKVLCLLATLIGLAMLASILFTLFSLGGGGLRLTVFTRMTAAAGGNGGLLNPIVGSLIQTGIGTVIGTPIGIMVGTYLSEYARGTWLGQAVRFVSDVLLSAPSILIGLFIYQLFVNGHGYSGLAGGLALAVIVIPIVVRTTEDMLRLIPVALREAAVALGAPKWRSVVQICWRAAINGMMTGILLAIARIAGETAPLIFTSLGNENWSVDLGKPMASLPVSIYHNAGSPSDDLVQLAWVGALIITVGVLSLNIVARFALRRR